MNKKYALVSIVLIALMSLSLLPIAFAWHTPCTTDDSLYEEFGPRPSQLLIKIYTDYAAELEGFKNKEVDVMDWALEPADYQWFVTNDPDHSDYSTAFYAEFGAFQYDWNCQAMPTSLLSVRQALAHLLDKQYFINTYLSGMAMKLDSVLNYLGAGWYNPACTDLYNLQPRTTMLPLPDDPMDFEVAFDLLLADLGAPVPDPLHPGEFMFTWASAFPDPDPTSTFPPVADGHFLFFARSESSARTQQGQYLKDLLEVYMPQVLDLLGKPRVRIYVDLYIAPRATCRPQVMGYYRYNGYSGGWILGRDPDFIMYYTTGMIAKPDPYGQNYNMYSNPDYDTEVDAMLVSDAPGSSGNPCDGVYHAWQAQAIMEGDQPVTWFWTTAGYKSYLSDWRGMVNQIGFGMNSWWSFMNGHKLGSESCDTLRYGWYGDVLTMNVISAQFYWDYEMLGKVYDGLLAVNPYNMADDRYWMASWETGTWDNGGNICTKITYHLREDIFWQDVPFLDRSGIAVGAGHQIDGPFTDVPVTPVDVVFSWQYQLDNPDSWSGWLLADVDHVVLSDAWTAQWPYTAITPPWWDLGTYNNAWVEFAAQPGYDIVVYMGVSMPWLALHWVSGLYILPMHIWSQIPISTSDAVDTWLWDITYGCGPYILLSRNPGVDMTMIPFRSGQSYRGVTLTKSYFASQPVRVKNAPLQYEAGITGAKVVFKTTFVGYDRMYAHDIEYFFSFGLRWATGSLNGTTTVKVTNTIAFGEQVTVYGVATLPPAIVWCNYVKIHVDLHWHIHSCSSGGACNFISLGGDLQEGIPTCPNWYSYELHVHPADISGGAAGFPYLNADHVCSIKDATLIGVYWMQLVPAGSDPTSNLARADINNDGIVSIKDATQIGVSWMRTW